MSYYGYVERKPEDIQVNWGEISQGILKSVKDWEKGREDLREKLDKETRETQKAIAETPETKSEPVQTWILKTATTASERLAELNRQLKSNQIKPREYNLLRSNIMSDVTGVYAFAKTFDQGYAAKLQRIIDDKASYVERKSAEKAEDFIGTNLSSLTPVIDETGTLIYKKSDGASMSYREIVKNSTITRNNKNALDEVTKYAQSMKAHEVLQSDGSYKTSASLNEDAKRAIGSKVAEYLVDDNDVADILYDHGRKEGFEIKDGKVVVTEDDREEAREILLTAARGTFGMQITPAPQIQTSTQKPTEAEERALLFGQNLQNLNDPGNQEFVADAIKAKSMKYEGGTLTIVNDNGTIKKVSLAPDKVAEFLIKRARIVYPNIVKKVLGKNHSTGSFNYPGDDEPVEPPKMMKMFTIKDDEGKDISKVKLGSIDLSNLVADYVNANKGARGKIEYREDGSLGPRVVFHFNSGPVYAQTREGLNKFINRFNKEFVPK